MIIGIIHLILMFFFVMLFVGAWFVFRIIYSLFNVRKQFNKMGEEMRDGKRRGGSSDKETVYDNRSKQDTERKIFSDDEGEYVDFEEVK